MITDVEGISVGQYTNLDAMTGCTVVLCPPGTSASCEVRGSAPGSRELALLAPDKQMQEVHAILLTGGSAYGLGAASGVMTHLAEKGIGYKTPWAIVPIVPAAVIFDLNVGRLDIFPRHDDAYQACRNSSSQVAEGNVGAGTGATVGKWAGLDHAMKGGLGTSSVRFEDIVVGALAVVNAVGDVIGDDGKIIAGAVEGKRFLGDAGRWKYFQHPRSLSRNTNTTLVVSATNAQLSKVDLFRVAQRMHNGVARAINPSHTTFDGDVSFALSCGTRTAAIDLIAEMAAKSVAAAILSAVRHATTLGTIPGFDSILRH